MKASGHTHLVCGRGTGFLVGRGARVEGGERAKVIIWNGQCVQDSSRRIPCIEYTPFAHR
jgi:hypothetical protein